MFYNGYIITTVILCLFDLAPCPTTREYLSHVFPLPNALEKNLWRWGVPAKHSKIDTHTDISISLLVMVMEFQCRQCNATLLCHHTGITQNNDKRVPAACRLTRANNRSTQINDTNSQGSEILQWLPGRNISLCFPEQPHLVPLDGTCKGVREPGFRSLLQLFLAGWAWLYYANYLSCNFLFT